MRTPSFDAWIVGKGDDFVAGSDFSDETIDSEEFTAKAEERAWHLFWFNMAGGAVFMAQFGVSMSHLCHVYYGPAAARERAGR